MSVESVPLERLHPAEWNPRLLKEKRFKDLCRSLQADPAFLERRPILATLDGTIYAGNQRYRAAQHLGWTTVPAVLDDLTPEEAKARAIRDNTSAGEWQEDEYAALLYELSESGADLSALGADQNDIDRLLASVGVGLDHDGLLPGPLEPPSEAMLSKADWFDALWSTDNEWDIPTLNPRIQADAIDQPPTIWGSVARSAYMPGTYLFYTEDARFEALWRDPTPVPNSKCATAAEPNFSCYGNLSKAFALYQIYRKRTIARFWQSKGVRILVDLNVAERFADINLLGVPKGWRAYATRGYTERMDATVREYERACQRAESDDILFLVYGGGRKVRTLCGERGWIWFDEEMNRRGGDSDDSTG